MPPSRRPDRKAVDVQQLQAQLDELRQRLESLERAEKRFGILEKLAPVGIFLTDANGACRFVNDRWLAISGLSAEQAQGEGWTTALHPADRQRVVETWYRSAREHTPFELEYRFLRPDGQVTWVLGRAVAERDPDGRVLGYVGTITDITDRLAAEARAEAHLARIDGLNRISKGLQDSLDSDEATQGVLEHLLDLFQADRAFLLYPCDPQAAEVSVPYEVTRPGVVGARERGFVAPIDPFSAGLFQRALDTAGAVVVDRASEYEAEAEWLRRFSVQSILAIAIRPRVGKPWLLGLHLCSDTRGWSPEDQDLLRDIALRMGDAFSHMLVFKELKQSEAKLRAIIDNTTDAIYIKDRSGRILLVNPAAAEIMGRPGVDVWDPEVRSRIHQDDMRVIASGETLTFQELVKVPHLGERLYSTTKFPYRDAQGTIIGVIGISRDITELRRTHEEVALRTSELQRAKELDRLKSQFVNSVTHELRTPLTSILGYAEFLEDGIGGVLTDEQGRFVMQIRSGAKRLEGLLNDLLDFARMEAGTFTLRLVRLDLRDKIQEVVESLRPQAEDAGVALEASLPDAPLEVTLDADRIGQVILNFVSNGIKFTPPGGRIVVRACLEAGNLRCEVADTGEGIDAVDQPRLFQRFSQLESGLGKGKGSGLGLSISKALIDAHHGQIGVDSRLGEGSTFWFTVPVDGPGA